MVRARTSRRDRTPPAIARIFDIALAYGAAFIAPLRSRRLVRGHAAPRRNPISGTVAASDRRLQPSAAAHIPILLAPPGRAGDCARRSGQRPTPADGVPGERVRYRVRREPPPASRRETPPRPPLAAGDRCLRPLRCARAQ